MLLSAQAALGSRVETSAWDNAVRAREVFEAKPPGTHTKIEYAHVMDGFRVIYHGNPSDAPTAVRFLATRARHGIISTSARYPFP